MNAQTVHENVEEIYCGAFMPKMFEPNPASGKVMKFEVIGVRDLHLTLYNNLGVEVLETTVFVTSKNGLQAIERKHINIFVTDDEIYNPLFKEGNYYYKVEILCENDNELVQEGEMKLIRTSRR